MKLHMFKDVWYQLSLKPSLALSPCIRSHFWITSKIINWPNSHWSSLDWPNECAMHSSLKGWQNLFTLFSIFGFLYVYEEQKMSISYTPKKISCLKDTLKFTYSSPQNWYRLIYVVEKDDLGTFLWDSTEKYAKTSHLFMFAYSLETTFFICTYCNLFGTCWKWTFLIPCLLSWKG